MIVTFDISDSVATELKGIAHDAGFPNAKVMTIAYWKACILAARQKALSATVPQANTDDVEVS